MEFACASEPEPEPPANRTPTDECRDCCLLAVYKPRHVLSCTGARAADGRHNLTDLLRAAGAPSLRGHIGRLDFCTSGVILVTNSTRLHEAVAKHGDRARELLPPVLKTYRLLLAGRWEADATEIQALSDPLEEIRGEHTVVSDAATVRHHRTFCDTALAVDYMAVDTITSVPFTDTSSRGKSKSGSGSRQQQSADGTGGAPRHVPFDGWLTEVDVAIVQGRKHQIRKLCTRSKLALRHLTRLQIGPLLLGCGPLSGMAPGDVIRLVNADLPPEWGAVRHCLCLAFPLPSRLKQAFALCVSTAFANKTAPFLAVHSCCGAQRRPETGSVEIMAGGTITCSRRPRPSPCSPHPEPCGGQPPGVA